MLSKSDEELRHAWQCGGGKGYGWVKSWNEELRPALIYCRQLSITKNARVKMLENGRRCGDVTIRHRSGVEDMLEITMAFQSWASGDNPGYQESMRWEKLNADGFVSATTPLTRNPQTKRVEYAELEIARSVDELIDSWATGIEWALRRKQRPNYGEGKTLIVYCDGLSGDFEYPRRKQTLIDVVSRIDRDCCRNGFDRTVLVGWHQGWAWWLI